ncbi:histone H2A-beta, sperm-like [Sphaerodactylus townsendi]|uniref:histone H2A-beta, sperm-like n=1 Tax=Sphaerodactylus townsendi TaxID=933632 RepID=UPI0020264461|nr:histone H2A-beta, sperm-like [Sphaerodactylus townsendi]
MSDSQCDMDSSDEAEPSPRKRRPKTSRSCRAGLIFPVGRIDRFLRAGDYAERIGSGASVYMAAVLQYLTYDIVDIAGNIAANDHRRRIAPRHLLETIHCDSELQQVFGGAILPPQGRAKKQSAPSSRRGKGKKMAHSVRRRRNSVVAA